MIQGIRIFLQPGCSGYAKVNGRVKLREIYLAQNTPTSQPPNPYGVDVLAFYEDNSAVQDGTEVPPSQMDSFFTTNRIWMPFYNQNDAQYEQFQFDNYGQSPEFGLIQNQVANGYLNIIEIENLLDPMNEPEWPYNHETLVAGNNTILFPAAKYVEVVITTRGPAINNWYGEPDTGKFGFVTEIYGPNQATLTSYGELHYLNFQTQRIKLIPA